jgi:hypothetical protein
VAGCNESTETTPPPTGTSTASPTPEDTATGTNTATAVETTGEQVATGTASSTSTDSDDGESDVRKFDGGGAAAFADALDWLAEDAGRTLRFVPGTYRFDASQVPDYGYPLDAYRTHFGTTGLEDAAIVGPPPEADGTAEVVLADPTRGFLLFADATAPTVRDLTVRHDPWPQTQGTIRRLGDGGRTVTLALDEGFPTFDESPFAADPAPEVAASVFESDGSRVERVTGDERGNFKRVASTERVGDRTYRLELAPGVESGGLAVGRRLGVVARRTSAGAVVCVDTRRPSVERLTVRSAPGFCLWFVASDRPRVTETTLATATDGERLVSVNADGVHCDNCPRGPRVERCRFERCGDDTVVADNELLIVDGFEDDRTVRIRSTFGARVGAGDRLTAASPTLEVRGTLPPVAEVDERGGGVTTDVVNPELVVFESAVDGTLAAGDLLTGPRLRNADTVVHDCVARSIRARYVRLGGVDGATVAGNEFVGTHSDGVEVEAVGNTSESSGFPKGWSADVTVADNRIERTGLVGVPSGVPRGVHVGADVGESFGEVRSGRPHGSVTLSGNEVVETAGPGIEVHDAAAATVRDNRVVEPGRIPLVERGNYGVGLRNVGAATVEETVVSTAAERLNGFGWRQGVDGLSASDNRYVVDGRDREPELESI